MNLFRRWSLDPAFISLTLLLSLFGIAMIFSAGVLNVPSSVTEGAWLRQLLWLVIALTAFSVASRIPTGWIEWVAFPAYIFALVLLAATLAIGFGTGTAGEMRGWIQVGGFRFQPSEFAKIASILGLARLLASRDTAPSKMRDLLAPAALMALPMALVMLQPDLGTAFTFVGILFAALFWAGTPPVFLFLLASPGLALILSFSGLVWSAYFIGLAGVLYALRYRLFMAESFAVILANLAAGTMALPLWNGLGDYQRNRLMVFLDPSIDPRGAGWNLMQSKIAIGSGGLFGKGYTEGTQKSLDFLPEQHTDFIFSVIAEELGFVGVCAAIAVFFLLLRRLSRMAEASADPFAGIVLFGILGTWITHIFVNIGMTVGIFPIIGIPLPFVSYGGTFLLTCWVMAALAARLASEE
jgi:rod shape determining protein RodA